MTLPSRMTVIAIKAPGGPEMLVPATRPLPQAFLYHGQKAALKFRLQHRLAINLRQVSCSHGNKLIWCKTAL